MDPLDPALQSTAVSEVKPLLTLVIFTGLGSFFLGALVTAIRIGTQKKMKLTTLGNLQFNYAPFMG